MMKSAILQRMEIEGSDEVVSIFYQKQMLGSPRITSARVGNREVLHLMSELQKVKARREITQVLGQRPLEVYKDDFVKDMRESMRVHRQLKTDQPETPAAL